MFVINIIIAGIIIALRAVVVIKVWSIKAWSFLFHLYSFTIPSPLNYFEEKPRHYIHTHFSTSKKIMTFFRTIIKYHYYTYIKLARVPYCQISNQCSNFHYPTPHLPFIQLVYLNSGLNSYSFIYLMSLLIIRVPSLYSPCCLFVEKSHLS